VLDQLHKIEAQASGTVAESIKDPDKKVETILRGSTAGAAEAAQEPSLTRENSALSTIYNSIGQADVAPTPAQTNAAAETEHDLSAVMKHWEEIKNSALPALNQQLKSANLPEIRLDVKAQDDENPH